MNLVGKRARAAVLAISVVPVLAQDRLELQALANEYLLLELRRGNQQGVFLALEAGAVVDEDSVETMAALEARIHARGENALEFAVGTGSPELVRMALRLPGIDGDASGDQGSAALRLALRWRLDAIARILLDAGADPIAIFRWELERELTPATKRRDIPCVRRLLDAGADLRHSTVCALAEAIRSGDSELLRQFLAIGLDPDASCEVFNSVDPLLSAAAVAGNVDAMRLLLHAGADPNAHGRPGPLGAAARGGHVAAVMLLLDAGARLHDVHAHGECLDDWDGGTALAFASHHCQPHVVELLRAME